MATMTATGGREVGMTSEQRMVIFASSLGTVFEWYDFYIYGTLGVFLAKYFFSNVPPNVGFIFALLAFAAGFAVRPFGALIFGRLGDMIGRKYTFLVTMSLMGVGTFFIGVLPGYATWGIAAPIVLIALRLVQGLALGGEYGGAAIYVAEHAPKNKRGFYTSWIQTTATLGLFMALLLILGIRTCDGRSRLRRLGLAHSVPALGDPAWRSRSGSGSSSMSCRCSRRWWKKASSRSGRCRKPSASGRTPRSRSWRCSAPPPVKPSCGTADSSTRCSS